MKNQKLGMKNTYTIYKYVGGEKVILARFHNIATSILKRMVTGTQGLRLHSVWFGDGSAEPSESDTALTHPLWTFSWNYSNIISVETPVLDEEGVWNARCTARINATSDYVGTVSEVGIYICTGNPGLGLGTHALIKDAEGNPMTITKTENEVLFVDIHMQIQVSASGGFEWTQWYYYLLGEGSSSGGWPYLPSINGMSVAMLRSHPDIMTGGAVIGSRVELTHSYDANSGVLTCSGGRFGNTNQVTQEYVNAIGLIASFNSKPSSESYKPGVPIGVWKFPNAEIFPNTTLSDMRVGSGDGQTTEFTPPLNLWVRDSEQIYVDGVLQVRGVDYTCDHRNNLSRLLSLMPSNFCTLKNDVVRLASAASNTGQHPLKGGINKVTNGSNNYGRMYLVWDQDHPLEWELDEDPQIGMDADGFHLAGICSTANTSWRYAVVKLSYSENGTDWTEAGVYTVTDTNTTMTAHDFVFEDTVTAKYWKLSIDVSACSDRLKTARFYSNQSNNVVCYLYRNGAPIIFTEAPAEGAVITMNAQIDRPMKNENFILDVNPSFSV